MDQPQRTAFLLAPTDPDADYRVRIFTPVDELPFAGHPTLGSARAWLDRGGVPRSTEHLVQQCADGKVRVRRHGERLAFAAPPLLRGNELSSDERGRVTRALGLRPEQVVGARWADNGSGWAALLLTDAVAVLSIEAPTAPVAGFVKIGVVAPQRAGSQTAFEVRGLTSRAAAGEDPVTGSLHAGIAQWLVPSGLAPPSYVASQGTRLGRRGRVHITQQGDDLWVGGDSVVGVRGTVQL